MSAAKTLVLSVGVLLTAVSCAKPEVIQLTVGREVFSVEVARTNQEQQKGLMGRRKLGPQEGMLFVYEADERLAFWMKNTPLPLSIAFLSSSGVITEMRDMRSLSTDTIHSRLACRYALEVNLGAFDRAGVTAGDTIGFPEGFR